jgi:hypothetical protein
MGLYFTIFLEYFFFLKKKKGLYFLERPLKQKFFF